jgi:hypothetical protein
MGENPKANPRKQPCRENKAGRQPYKKQGIEPTPEVGRQASIFRRYKAIPKDREKTLRKENNKAWGVEFNPRI